MLMGIPRTIKLASTLASEMGIQAGGGAKHLLEKGRHRCSSNLHFRLPTQSMASHSPSDSGSHAGAPRLRPPASRNTSHGLRKRRSRRRHAIVTSRARLPSGASRGPGRSWPLSPRVSLLLSPVTATPCTTTVARSVTGPSPARSSWRACEPTPTANSSAKRWLTGR